MKDTIFLLVGGLGLFLFGMREMSDGLRRAAGGRLEHILGLLTRTLWVAVFVGAAVTCLIQSSSATTVMIIGFVNARLLGLRQAIGAIMGANIGTTITAWLVATGLAVSAMKITLYSLPMIGIGFLCNAAVRSRTIRLAGQVVLGLGLLFLGLSFMTQAFEPMAKSQATREMFARLGRNPMLGILVGMAITALVQSSSATIAIFQALAVSGIIGLEEAIPLMLGAEMGTCVTAMLASIGTNRNARRAAIAHLLFNTFGVLWALPLVYLGWYPRIIDALVPGAPASHAAFHIAAAHSLFKVVNTVLFAPCVGLLERAAVALAGGKGKEDDGEPHYLEPHLLVTPSAALEGARREIIRMLQMARSGVTMATNAFFNADRRQLRSVMRGEENVDRLQRQITEYLVEISRGNLEPEESRAFPVLVHTVNDIERVSDHAENIAELAERRIDSKLTFSSQATGELMAMWRELSAMINDTLEGLRGNAEAAARRALKREERINQLETSYRLSHAQRLTEGACQVAAGLVFLELVANFEKIADHLTNINQALLGSFQWGEPVHTS